VHVDEVTPFAAALIGIGYGVAHGLGPDHLAALGTLLARPGPRGRAIVACARFGVGHAVVLGALGAGAACSGWLVPATWERAAEAAGGALLVVLGLVALVRALPLLVHRHRHAHDEEDHEHWHLHIGNPARHRHGHPALVGGALALSGVRSLAIAVSPLLLAGRSAESALAFVCGFGLGVVSAMMAFGLLFQAGGRLFGRHVASVAIGGASVVLGGWWIWTSLV
jgi:nickel/cobalt transporter (NicO) family protein